MADPFAVARDYLARLCPSGGWDHPTLLEPLAPPPVTDPERLATLDTEEVLFRVFWKTLLDKTLARQTWPSDLRRSRICKRPSGGDAGICGSALPR